MHPLQYVRLLSVLGFLSFLAHLALLIVFYLRVKTVEVDAEGNPVKGFRAQVARRAVNGIDGLIDAAPKTFRVFLAVSVLPVLVFVGKGVFSLLVSFSVIPVFYFGTLGFEPFDAIPSAIFFGLALIAAIGMITLLFMKKKKAYIFYGAYCAFGVLFEGWTFFIQLVYLMSV